VDNTHGLRRWQQQALHHYTHNPQKDFLIAATPGAGKTTFALTLANELLRTRVVDRVIIVVPTDHLRTQWQNNAAAAGIDIDTKPNDAHARGAVGYVTTYAQVARSPVTHRRRCEARRTLVIFDEIHHTADGSSWGDAIGEAFTPAQRRLALTGTPFRSRADEKIPFVSYTEEDTGWRCLPDYEYSYRDGLRDGALRPVMFAAYKGQARWMNDASEVLAATLGSAMSKRSEQYAWRTVLHPRGKWLPHVIAAADARLTDIRDAGTPDAGALLLARDQDHARECAAIIRTVTGHTPTVVVSDDPRSSAKLSAYTTGSSRWLVAVRQVSEGVDVPRLCVAVWATTYRTPLFFAQAVGRVLRARGRHETATVFLPAVRPLLALAAQMEEHRNNVLTPRATPGDTHDLNPDWDPIHDTPEPSTVPTFTAIDADAEFAQVLHAGTAITPDTHPTVTDPGNGQLSLPGLASPEHTAHTLAARDHELKNTTHTAAAGETTSDTTTARRGQQLRAEIHASIQYGAHKTGQTPAHLYRLLHNHVPGPPTRIADERTLEKRRDWLLARGY